MSKNPLISANAVAKPPQGAKIAAHGPPDPPVLSNAVAYPPHDAGADGKYATNSKINVSKELNAIVARVNAICAEFNANCAQMNAKLAKLVDKRAGRSATTFTGQLAVAGQSGISPEWGGGCCVWLW